MKIIILTLVFVTVLFCFSSLFPWKADDTYLQLKKDLEYLDLKVGGGSGEIPQFSSQHPPQAVHCHLLFCSRAFNSLHWHPHAHGAVS